MKNILQLFLFVCILAGAFWVGLQWGNRVSDDVNTDLYQQPSQISSELSSPSSNTSLSGEISHNPSTSLPVVPEVSESSTSPSDDLPKNTTEKITTYSNANFGYAFDMPANVYYSGFGSVSGARHTVGIGKEMPETFDDASVRVYFYGKKVLPELQGAHNNKIEDPSGKYIYLLLDGTYSVKIEAQNIQNPVVQKIVQTIHIVK